eukprot:Skav223694  [mRNA]  locus=scaffold1907:157703:158878:+ [translate_table: standard]
MADEDRHAKYERKKAEFRDQYASDLDKSLDTETKCASLIKKKKKQKNKEPEVPVQKVEYAFNVEITDEKILDETYHKGLSDKQKKVFEFEWEFQNNPSLENKLKLDKAKASLANHERPECLYYPCFDKRNDAQKVNHLKDPLRWFVNNTSCPPPDPHDELLAAENLVVDGIEADNLLIASSEAPDGYEVVATTREQPEVQDGKNAAASATTKEQPEVQNGKNVAASAPVGLFQDQAHLWLPPDQILCSLQHLYSTPWYFPRDEAAWLSQYQALAAAAALEVEEDDAASRTVDWQSGCQYGYSVGHEEGYDQALKDMENEAKYLEPEEARRYLKIIQKARNRQTFQKSERTATRTKNGFLEDAEDDVDDEAEMIDPSMTEPPPSSAMTLLEL